MNFLFLACYFVVLRATPAGQTLGNMAAHIRIVRSDLGQLNYTLAAVRFLVSIASASVGLLGYLPAVFDRRRRTLHDRVAGTLVIRESAR